MMLGRATCWWCRGNGWWRTSCWVSVLLLIAVWGSVCLSASESGTESGPLLSWGQNFWELQSAPNGQYVAVAAGAYHNLGLTADGALRAWGENYNGQCNSPYGNNFVAIAAGFYHNVALRSDGSIVVWGDNSRGQCRAPAAQDYLAIAAGDFHSVAIRSDGSLVAWGWNEYGQCDVPAGTDFRAIAAGRCHSLALKLDGSILAWGADGDRQCEVPEGHDFVAISAGSLHSLALRSDGSLVAWGRDDVRQCDVPAGGDFVAISAGAFHNLALRADGAVIAWGLDRYEECDVPTNTYAAMIAAGGFHSLAIGAERKDVAIVEIATTEAAAPLDADVVEPMDVNAVDVAVADANSVTMAVDRNLSATTDPNAAAPADAVIAAPVDASAGEAPATDTVVLVDRHARAGGDARPDDSGRTPSAAPSGSEAASPTQETGQKATARYGSVESYGCVNQNDPRARPVYHFTSETLTPHFYTISKEERDKLIDESPDVWTYQGRAFNAFPEGQQPEGAIPVYRFWSNLLETHFYTMDEQEKKTFIEDYPDLCEYQGVAWYTDKLPPSEPAATPPSDKP